MAKPKRRRQTSRPPKVDPAEQAERRQRREERLRQEERARQAARRRALVLRLGIGAAVVAAVVAGAVALSANRRADQKLVSSLTAGSCSYDTRTDPGKTGQHAPQVSYRVDPPAGGIHLPAAAAPRTYAVTDRPPDGQVVHATEHGDIVLWHRPELPEADVAKLVAIADRNPKDVLVVPRESLPTPVAATAWHRRLLCKSMDEPALARFVQEFKDKGPESVPE